jgi:hypothetical protein
VDGKNLEVSFIFFVVFSTRGDRACFFNFFCFGNYTEMFLVSVVCTKSIEDVSSPKCDSKLS